MIEEIVITSDMPPIVCDRIAALLKGRAYRTFDGKSMAHQVRLDRVVLGHGALRIVDSEGVLVVDPQDGPASILFDDLGLTLRYTSRSGDSCVYIYTLEDAP